MKPDARPSSSDATTPTPDSSQPNPSRRDETPGAQSVTKCSARERLIAALDLPDWAAAEPLADALAGEVGLLKVGLELFVSEGPSVVARVRARAPVFLDLKLHDIPATIERAVASAAATGASLLTVHAASGGAALERAVRRCEGSGLQIVAVTVLTSLDDDDLAAQGLGPAATQVERLAALAWSAGVRAFVASPHEAGRLKQRHPQALVITPGIRASVVAGAAAGATATAGATTVAAGATGASDDQRRVASAFEAIRGGSDRLVVGRPLRDAPDRVAAARSLVNEIEAGLKARA